MALNADYIATGHYVRRGENGEPLLLKGLDGNKDQSYFLYAVGKDEIAREPSFPLVNLKNPKCVV